jgi:hypothetical protein
MSFNRKVRPRLGCCDKSCGSTVIAIKNFWLYSMQRPRSQNYSQCSLLISATTLYTRLAQALDGFYFSLFKYQPTFFLRIQASFRTSLCSPKPTMLSTLTLVVFGLLTTVTAILKVVQLRQHAIGIAAAVRVDVDTAPRPATRRIVIPMRCSRRLLVTGTEPSFTAPPPFRKLLVEETGWRKAVASAGRSPARAMQVASAKRPRLC